MKRKLRSERGSGSSKCLLLLGSSNFPYSILMLIWWVLYMVLPLCSEQMMAQIHRTEVWLDKCVNWILHLNSQWLPCSPLLWQPF
eukprot:SAG31_NODE_65_length_28565_cov_8.402914_21_plen_85_part_00